MEVVTLDVLGAIINSLKYANGQQYTKLKKTFIISYYLAMEVKEEKVYNVSMAALLKNIGSIGIEHFSEEEKKYRTYKSAEIIRIMPEIIPFQYEIADIILEIDERIDGSGNPAGKEKILEEAQIVGIVEEYMRVGDIKKLNPEQFSKKLLDALGSLIESEGVRNIIGNEKKLDIIFKKYVNSYNIFKEYIEGVEEEQFLSTISSLIDAKHKYTAGHTRRVASYSYSIAKEMGYSEEDMSHLRYSAYLHDIGKLAVDLNILDKPGKLTDEEFDKMKKHAEYSYRILEDSPKLKTFAEGALHHERVDGKGYPFGLKGNDIPEVAKIISIADVLDALTSNRAYRKPFTFKEAFELMELMVGKSFDKRVFKYAKICFNID